LRPWSKKPVRQVRENLMRRTIVIGLDGATFDLLDPLMQRGLLPNLKGLVDRGVRGRLRTVIPPGTGPAWSSIVTGLDPSNHGIFDLIVRAVGSYNLGFLNSESLRAPTVWDVVGVFGGRVLVLNVPMTYPPHKVNGYLVSGLLTPAGSDRSTYPPDLLGTLKGLEPGYKIVPTQAFSPGRVEAFMDELERVFDSKARVLKYLLKQADWQFVMQVFNETDFLQHALWYVLDPQHPRHSADLYRRYAGRIEGFYRKADALIGEIVETAGKEASVMVISDHGHGPLHEFIHTNNLFIEKGLMKVKADLRSRLKYALFRMGFTPLGVYRAGNALGLARLRMGLRWTSKGYRMLARLFFSFSDIDWKRTAAYAISGGVYGAVFVNLKGREPEGAVDPADYEATRRRLAEVLMEMRHPGDGGRLVKSVLKREDVYRGRFTPEAPDLFFEPRDPTVGVFGDFEFSSNRIVEPASEAISAQHRMEGVFMASGPDLKPGTDAQGLRVIDVAPTLLHLMELPVPEGLDGRVVEDVLTDEVRTRRPPKYFRPQDMLDTSGGDRQTMEDESIKERLKGLGYIS
jgi:predicted AlkP superfamily phosphohydrolase/phosphomutase